MKEKMLKTVIVAGIIQIILASSMAILCGITSNKYNDIVVIGTELSGSVNELMNSLNDINADIDNGNMDFTIPVAEMNTIEKGVNVLDDNSLYPLYYSFRGKYDILCRNLKSIKTKDTYGNTIDEEEKELMIENPIADMQIIANHISEKTVNANEKTLFLGNKYLNYTKWLSILMVITVLISAGICIHRVKSTGNKMEVTIEKVQHKADQNYKKANTDALTGLWNRGYTEKVVNKAIKDNIGGCLFMFDMDNFKKVNDTYGHIAGDNILKAFARTLRKTFRDTDVPCRIGGDEFILFAKEIPVDRVNQLGDSIIRNMLEEMKSIEGGNVVTVSIGIAMIGSDTTDFKSLYDKADGALYIVKNNGKNSYHIVI